MREAVAEAFSLTRRDGASTWAGSEAVAEAFSLTRRDGASTWAGSEAVAEAFSLTRQGSWFSQIVPRRETRGQLAARIFSSPSLHLSTADFSGVGCVEHKSVGNRQERI